MTFGELIKMVGSEKRADQVMEIMLKNVKPEFIKMVIRAELQNIEDEIKVTDESRHERIEELSRKKDSVGSLLRE